MILEYLAWTPDRATFLSTMQALINPLTEEPLITLDDDGNPLPCDGLRIDEIGEIVKGYDEEGNPTEIVAGHHVNLAGYGPIADMLSARGGWTGIFPLLGEMTFEEDTDGVPRGWVGTSGMKIYPAGFVSRRVRVWA